MTHTTLYNVYNNIKKNFLSLKFVKEFNDLQTETNTVEQQMYKDNYLKDLESNNKNIVTINNSKYLDYELKIIPSFLYLEYLEQSNTFFDFDNSKMYEFCTEHIENVGTLLVSHKNKTIFLKGE